MLGHVEFARAKTKFTAVRGAGWGGICRGLCRHSEFRLQLRPQNGLFFWNGLYFVANKSMCLGRNTYHSILLSPLGFSSRS